MRIALLSTATGIPMPRLSAPGHTYADHNALCIMHLVCIFVELAGAARMQDPSVVNARAQGLETTCSVFLNCKGLNCKGLQKSLQLHASVGIALPAM